MPKPPAFPEVEAAIRAIAAELENKLRDLAARSPAEAAPSILQLQALISQVVNGVAIDAIRAKLVADLTKLFTTGKGEVKHSPVDLA